MYKAVVIGVSAGGLNALRILLSRLPDDFSLPVLIVQHVSATSDNYLVTYLNDHCNVPVKEGEEKEEILPGKIYVAPPNYHLVVEEDLTLSLSADERVNFARPSIDVLFESAAYAYGPALIGIVLTGANNDGSRGLKLISNFGGLAIVQDPKTAEVDTMPLAAIAAARVDHVLPLEGIADLLINLQ